MLKIVWGHEPLTPLATPVVGITVLIGHILFPPLPRFTQTFQVYMARFSITPNQFPSWSHP